VKEEIRKYIEEEMLTDEVDVKDETSLFRSKLLDSLSLLKLTMFLEESFLIEVDSSDISPDNFDSITSIADYVARKKGVQS